VGIKSAPAPVAREHSTSVHAKQKPTRRALHELSFPKRISDEGGVGWLGRERAEDGPIPSCVAAPQPDVRHGCYRAAGTHTAVSATPVSQLPPSVPLRRSVATLCLLWQGPAWVVSSVWQRDDAWFCSTARSFGAWEGARARAPRQK
jgi:hypothetical protein